MLLFVTKKTVPDKRGCYKLEGMSICKGKEGDGGDGEKRSEKRGGMEVEKVVVEVSERGAPIWNAIHEGMCYRIETVTDIAPLAGT